MSTPLALLRCGARGGIGGWRTGRDSNSRKAKSNLSRTLRTMEGYGLVRLERGERGRIRPKVMHDRVELDLPLALSRKAS